MFSLYTEYKLNVVPLILSLKVPKCEIFHLFDLNDFYVIKSIKVGDNWNKIKN